jgi:DNA-binding response OmpR family regulator
VTNRCSIDQLVDALTSGVDAIWSLEAPTDVLMARCKALLRRSFATKQNNITPDFPA